MINTVIFDFDGTLADSLLVIWQVADELLVENKRPKLTTSQQQMIKSHSPREILANFHILLLMIPILLAKGKSKMSSHIEKISPVAGMKPVLKILQQKGIKLGLLSSNSLSNIQLFLKNNQMEMFDFVASESNLFGKDKALKKLINKYQLEKESLIYVGDEVRDIEACRKISLSIISVTWGLNSKERLRQEKPNYLINKPEEILRLFE